jgi:beta-lactamase class D
MSHRSTHRPTLAVLSLALALAGCSPAPNGPEKPAADALNADRLEAEIDLKMGGIGTCVILTDTASGHEVYRYNPPACRVPQPPCSTFDIPSALTGLDQGVITPATVFKWDGSPQPTHAWQADADISRASQLSIDWWWRQLSDRIGHDRQKAALKAYSYGDKNVDGPPTSFWMGPQAGGALLISPEQQMGFLRRFYSGGLPVKPETASLVQGLLTSETRTDKAGAAVITGKAASCSSNSDGSRGVAWWVGRLKTPTRDLIFVASLESANAPPGLEIEREVKEIFADVALWPAGG